MLPIKSNFVKFPLICALLVALLVQCGLGVRLKEMSILPFCSFFLNFLLPFFPDPSCYPFFLTPFLPLLFPFSGFPFVTLFVPFGFPFVTLFPDPFFLTPFVTPSFSLTLFSLPFCYPFSLKLFVPPFGSLSPVALFCSFFL